MFRTDLQGDIICVSDGNELTFAVEKNADYQELLKLERFADQKQKEMIKECASVMTALE